MDLVQKDWVDKFNNIKYQINEVMPYVLGEAWDIHKGSKKKVKRVAVVSNQKPFLFTSVEHTTHLRRRQSYGHAVVAAFFNSLVNTPASNIIFV